MLRHLLCCLSSFLILNTAFAKTADTSIVFLRVFGDYTIRVMSLDQANYYRVILPPDSGDNRYNAKEFYKDGKLKLVGKIYAGSSPRDRTSVSVTYDGECISYFPNGVKSSISYYKNGNKDGFEYLFYPNGKPYCTMKYLQEKSITYYWDWYDSDGNELCKNGNGKWVTYFDDYKTSKSEGQITGGEMDGEWHFTIFRLDTIKYTSKYKKGFLVSSIGYDKNGKAYPFKDEIERAHYKSRGLTFIEVLRSHIKLPRDSNGKKMSMDTMHISFVIEKDGHISNYKVLGDVNQQLKDAIFAGLDKMDNWTPQKIYGVPFRTEIIFPLNEVSGYSGNYYVKNVQWKERVIKDN